MTRAVVSAAVCLMAAGCAVDQRELSLSAAPRQVQANGDSTTLTVTAISSNGTAGTGTVTLTATVGVLKATTLTLTDGSATTTYSCASACGSSVTLTAAWQTGTADLLIRWALPPGDGGSTTPDAGTVVTPHDAGTPTVDAGTPAFTPENAVLVGEVEPGHLALQDLDKAAFGYGFTTAPDQLTLGNRGLLYRRGSRLFQYVPDALEPNGDGGWQWPTEPESNDVRIASSCPDGGMTRYAVGQTDELWFVCGEGSLRLTPGEITYPLKAGDVFIGGSGGTALINRDGGYVLQTAAGAVTPAKVTAGATLGGTAIRSTATGFDFAYELDGGCRLGRTTPAGAFTDVGQLALLSPQYEQTGSECLNARLETGLDGELVPLKRSADQTWVLVRRSLIATGAHIIFETSKTTPSDFSVDPPSVLFQSVDGFGVVTR